MSTVVAIVPLLLVLLLAVGALAALGAGVWLWLRQRKQQQEAGGACAKCGYSTRGLSTLTCPECGADLREVGIIQPGKPTMPMAMVLIAAGVLGLLALFCCGGMILPMFAYRTISMPPPPPTAIVTPVPTASAPDTAPATQPAESAPDAPGNPR